MKESIKDNELLPKRIVGMLRLDYFDDAVGPVEGFQIFGDFMHYGNELPQSSLIIYVRILIHLSQMTYGKRSRITTSPRF